MVGEDATQQVVQALERIIKLVAEVQIYWAKPLEVTVPQWSIIAGIKELDIGNGTSVGEVARRCRVDPSFVTAQSKILEKEQLIQRWQSKDDGRVVLMSLSPKGAAGLEVVELKQRTLNSFLFTDFSHDERMLLAALLQRLERRLLKAPLVLQLDD